MTDSVVSLFRGAVTRITALALAATAFAFSPAAHAAEAEADAAIPFDAIKEKLSGSSSTSILGDEDPAFRLLFNNLSGEGKKKTVQLTIPSIKPVKNYRLTSTFGFRTDPFKGRRARHKGIDMAGPVGTPIYATADGIVGRSQWVRGYGNYIEINHGNEIQTRYGHMSRLNVKANARVKAGDLIGFMGSTGRSTGSHLHYEVRIAGQAVNPMPFMQSNDFLLAQKAIPGVALGGPAE
ncbi:Murein DD-endopeptidase MepM and murein hydrolase activator NlpD, contain LysM domain [Parasphingorhabdus marina DSM 22363]|uniref:Murein DD-endopeptidase MepM and murein hydrolase activator NlpD, contain LysM domain n=1 Tax=Parasphingorhabdus marina DSM 22363 TaxID=1123272 RepID=A0A1N6CM21_9SPHN|nr:M23 family metallopeptidase [Parasphingorhabdus marina]SIN59529.1 Murein DD-endopeptidase MepM and murein hydrolase activator NlpD, contain LysM domain [Parasphingorhabdus marina DSM 22363]